LLRETKVIDINIELPVLFICVGLLLLLSHLLRLPGAADKAAEIDASAPSSPPGSPPDPHI
jgi:hypothetical protein